MFFKKCRICLPCGGDVKANFSKALGGFMLAGLIFAIVALIIGAVGTKWLDFSSSLFCVKKHTVI